MAQRRMFSPKIVSSDAFLDMPTSTQALYFHLGMHADDDGFVNPRFVMRLAGASEDDLKVLITKRFVLPFENGVIVIKHWKINNQVRIDRYRPTIYTEQIKTLRTKENGAYTDVWQPNGNQMATQYRLGKDSKYNAASAALPEVSLGAESNAKATAPTIHHQTKELFDYYNDQFLKRISKEKPTFSWGRCEKQAKPFLNTFGLEKLKQMVDLYFDANNKFYRDSGWGLQVFLMDTVIHSLSLKIKK
jgi:hypothetical protein